MRILTAKQIKQVEKRAFAGDCTEAGLMLKAGTACFNKILKYYRDGIQEKKVAVVCGNGKNAGDGFVIANLFVKMGADASIVLADKPPYLDEPKMYFDEAVANGVKDYYFTEYDFDCDIIVDCIFGIGFHGAPRAPFDEEEYRKFLNIDEVKGEAGYSTLERTGIRPCLDVNGIWGGYTGEGAKTVIPSSAHAKISMRLVPNQDHEKIAELFEKHIRAIAPSCVRVDVRHHHGGNGFLIPISSPAYQAASRAMTEVYGIEPVPSRGGGSIPILADLQKILGIDPLLMGFGLERDTIHSPNESYLLKQFFAGMESIALFYEYYKGNK